jgi:hypothetical protein
MTPRQRFPFSGQAAKEAQGNSGDGRLASTLGQFPQAVGQAAAVAAPAIPPMAAPAAPSIGPVPVALDGLPTLPEQTAAMLGRPPSGTEAPSALVGKTTTVIAPPVGSPPKKRRGRIVLSVVLIVLVALVGAGVAGYFAFGTQVRVLLTARDFCSAVERQNYGTAYSYFSSELQQQVPRNAFLAISTRGDTLEGKVTNCTASGVDVGASGQSATVHAVVTRALSGDTHEDLQLALIGGSWKISAPPDPLLLPLTTAYTFCQDLVNGDFNGAFQLFSLQTQQKVGNSLVFEGILAGSRIVTGSVKDCQATSVSLSANQQSLTVKSAILFQHFPNIDSQLDEVQDSPGHWSVQKLTLLVLGVSVTVPPGA